MTIHEQLKSRLVNHGLWDHEADSVLSIYMSDPSQESMKHRWNDDSEGYPVQLLSALWLALKSFALEYFDRECPKHWARPMFDDATDWSIETVKTATTQPATQP